MGWITLKPYYFAISLHSWKWTSGQPQQEYNFQSRVRQDRKFSHLISLYWNNCLKFILWCYPVYDAEWDIIQWEGNYFNRNLSYKINSVCLGVLSINWVIFSIFRILVFSRSYLLCLFTYLFQNNHLLFTIYGADHIWLTFLQARSKVVKTKTQWAHVAFLRELLGLVC